MRDKGGRGLREQSRHVGEARVRHRGIAADNAINTLVLSCLCSLRLQDYPSRLRYASQRRSHSAGAKPSSPETPCEPNASSVSSSHGYVDVGEGPIWLGSKRSGKPKGSEGEEVVALDEGIGRSTGGFERAVLS